MVYVLSAIVYFLILAAGVYIIKKNPKKVERYAIKLALMGFGVQIFINWAALGNLAFMPQIEIFERSKNSSLDLVLLSLVSVFCYAGLMVLFYKAYDYYKDDPQPQTASEQ